MRRRRFLVEAPLSRLAKWLRILGYDAAFVPPATVERLVTMAREEDRTILSPREGPRPLVEEGLWEQVVPGEVSGQLRQVVRRFGLSTEDHAFTRCVECNVLLTEVPKEEVWAVVPEFVYRHHSFFRRCPECRRVFWPGTHVQRMSVLLRSIEESSNGLLGR